MMRPDMIASLPIWGAGLLMAALVIGGAIAVELVARRAIPHHVRDGQNAVAASMLSVIGTTYAVLLAFVAMLAWEGFLRAQAVTDTEASLVQSAYVLIDEMDVPERTDMRKAIVGYAHAVISLEWPMQARGEAPPDDEANLSLLTGIAAHLQPATMGDGNLHTLLLRQLTDLASSRRERVFAAGKRIPPIIWFVLIAGGAISVAFSSFLGAPSVRMQLAMSSLLALSGALVLLMIVALSNPFRGDLRISPEPFERVLARMTAA